MASAFAELPLALFSTLAPMGAGAFLILAILFSTTNMEEDAARRIDKLTAIPVGLVIVGFIAAFFHLANPLHAFGVFSGIGSSPLSNELVAGCLFTLVMLVYWIAAMVGKLGAGARKGLLWVCAVFGIVFAWFTGAAYMIDTIPSWNTIAGPVQMVGFALIGGAAISVLMLTLAKHAQALKTPPLKTALLAVMAAGLVLVIGGVAAQAAAVSGMSNALVNGSDLVGSVMLVIVCGIICLVGTGVCDAFAVRASGAGEGALAGASWGAAVLALVGILLVRLAFYGMQLSVGLSIM